MVRIHRRIKRSRGRQAEGPPKETSLQASRHKDIGEDESSRIASQALIFQTSRVAVTERLYRSCVGKWQISCPPRIEASAWRSSDQRTPSPNCWSGRSCGQKGSGFASMCEDCRGSLTSFFRRCGSRYSSMGAIGTDMHARKAGSRRLTVRSGRRNFPPTRLVTDEIVCNSSATDGRSSLSGSVRCRLSPSERDRLKNSWTSYARHGKIRVRDPWIFDGAHGIVSVPPPNHFLIETHGS